MMSAIMSRSRKAAWGIFGLCQVLGVAGIWLYILSGNRDEVVGQGGFLVMVMVVFPVVGALIASRRPHHPVGWIYLCFGVLTIISMFSIAYAEYGLRYAPGAVPAPHVGAWLGTWLWIPGLILLATFSFLLFPNGHLPSPRWRVVAWISGAALGASVVYGLLLLRVPPLEVLEGEDLGAAAVVFLGVFGLAALGMVGSVTSLFVRVRNAAGEERQQLKWFLAAASLFAAGIPFAFDPLTSLPGAGYVAESVGFAIPIATGVAVLRYRLYDIDVIINRTLVYGGLTALLAAVYAAGVFGLGGALRWATGQQDNGLAVAGSTLAVAALFRPARARIQSFIDRRFYRRRYDAAQTLQAFSARLRDEVDLDELTRDLLVTVRDTMQPAHASVWLRGGAGR